MYSKMFKKQVKCYLNIPNFFYVSKDKCYASMTILNLVLHIIMISKMRQYNDSVENILPCGSIIVT